MTELFLKDYIKKLMLLEQKVGFKTGYKLYESPIEEPRDIVALNKVATSIAKFVGIDDLVVVAMTKHDDHTAGHIELNYTRGDVFIEVSRDLIDFPSACLATLAHEISHKYLHVNDISWGTGLESHYHDEILTDITAVFLGLGKLMLNGSSVEKVEKHAVGRETHTVTSVKSVGYLNRDQIACVYLLTCVMRKIPRSLYESGLSSGAHSSLRNSRDAHAYIFHNGDLHSPRAHREIRDAHFACSSRLRAMLDETDRQLNMLEQLSITETRLFLRKCRDQVGSFDEQIRSLALDLPPDPALRFLIGANLEMQRTEHRLSMNKLSGETEYHRRRTSSIFNLARRNTAVGYSGRQEIGAGVKRHLRNALEWIITHVNRVRGQKSGLRGNT